MLVSWWSNATFIFALILVYKERIVLISQQPDYPQYPPPQPPKRPWYKCTWKWYRTRSRRTQIIIAVVIILFVLTSAIVSAMTPAAPSQDSTSTPASTQPAAQQNSQPMQAPTQAPIAQPTQAPTSTPQSIHYPPTTEADLRGFAAEGDASALHEFHSESVGAVGVCPQPKRLENRPRKDGTRDHA